VGKGRATFIALVMGVTASGVTPGGVARASTLGEILAAAADIAEEQLLGPATLPADEVRDLAFSRQFTFAGTVTGSLADSAALAGVPRAAMLEAERALAHDIDLDRELRTGDRFAVHWQREFNLLGQPVGIGRVIAAELHTLKKGTLRIVRFSPVGNAAPQGERFFFSTGLEAAAPPIALPLDRIEITSGYGLRRDPLDQVQRVPPVLARPAQTETVPQQQPAPERKMEDRKEIIHAYMGFDRGALGSARDANPGLAGFSEIDRMMAERRVRARERKAQQDTEKLETERKAADEALAPPPTAAPPQPEAPVLLYMHEGLDLLANVGTEIHAAADGFVTLARRDRGYGNAIHIEHAGKLSTIYGHLSRFAEGIEPGVYVRRGQVIGYVGNTGRSTGAHLHFEVLVAGRPVDPSTLTRPTRLGAFDLARFKKLIDREQQDEQRLVSQAEAAGR
jgi:hypothetical protein